MGEDNEASQTRSTAVEDIVLQAMGNMEADLTNICEVHPNRANIEGGTKPVQAESKRKKLFVIKESRGKGLGMFARTKLPQGTLILDEKPAILLEDQRFNQEEIQSQYDHLSHARKIAYMSLQSNHNPDLVDDSATCGLKCCTNKKSRSERYRSDQQFEARRSAYATVHSVFVSNSLLCFNGAAVGLNYSRINHDCRPNALARFNANTKHIEVRLIYAVEANEEVTVTYVMPLIPPQHRRHCLSVMGVDCQCTACEGVGVEGSPAYKSDLNRMKIRSLSAEMEAMGSTFDTRHVVTSLSRERAAEKIADDMLQLDKVLQLHTAERIVSDVQYSADSAKALGSLACRLAATDTATYAVELANHLSLLFHGEPDHSKVNPTARTNTTPKQFKDMMLVAAAKDVLQRLKDQGY